MELVDPRIDPALVPDGSAARIINGPDKEYRDLPSVVTPTGRIITRWSPSDQERLAIVRGEDIYITILAGANKTISPLMVTVGVIDWKAI